MNDKSDQSSNKKLPRITNAVALRHAALRQVPRRTIMRGAVVVPAVPALLNHYVGVFSSLFGAMGKTRVSQQVEHLRKLLDQSLLRGYRASPYSLVRVEYQTEPSARLMLSYQVTVGISSIASQYDVLLKKHGSMLFGKEPDSVVLELSESFGSSAPILDLGAGLGRNAFPLARRGFAVDAVEITPSLAGDLRDESADQELPVRVFEGDGISRLIDLPRKHYQLIFCADLVTAHVRSPAHLTRLFERAYELLRPGGILLFNAFVTDENYVPDDLARQLSEVFWSVLFTPKDFQAAAHRVPFEKVLDKPAGEGMTSLPPSLDWLPITEACDWARVRQLFDLPKERTPAELRWLAFRKKP